MSCQRNAKHNSLLCHGYKNVIVAPVSTIIDNSSPEQSHLTIELYQISIMQFFTLTLRVALVHCCRGSSYSPSTLQYSSVPITSKRAISCQGPILAAARAGLFEHLCQSIQRTDQQNFAPLMSSSQGPEWFGPGTIPVKPAQVQNRS